MNFPISFHVLACCFAVIPSVCRGVSAIQATFEQATHLTGKKMVGDAVTTYDDVSAMMCASHCASSQSCGAFTHSGQERRCTFCAMCGNFSLVDTMGYRLYVLTDLEQGLQAEDGLCPERVTTPEGCWAKVQGLFAQVSVGPLGVWGVNEHERVYYRAGTHFVPYSSGNAWYQVGELLVQIDVSNATTWGVNNQNMYYYRENVTESSPTGTKWIGRVANTRLKWISASPGGSLWGRNTADQVVHYQNSAWQEMGMYIQKVDAGLAGVWVLDITGQLFHRLGTYGDSGSAGTGWRGVDGMYRSVSAGKNLVVAVDMWGQVWLRTGLGPDTPTGLAWTDYPGSLKQVDVYQTDMGAVFWGVDFSGKIFYSLSRM